MTTDETPVGPPNPEQVQPPTSPPLGILPALPERRAWPWAMLLAVAHQISVGLGIAALSSQQEALNFFFVFILGLVPVAFVVGLVLIVRKRSFPGRVLMFGVLFSFALVALEIAVAAGVCFYALSKPGAMH